MPLAECLLWTWSGDVVMSDWSGRNVTQACTYRATRQFRLCPFADKLDLVQVLNFAVKLALRQPEDTRVDSLAKYVLEMARFDLSHDLRDRARFMTAVLGLATADEGVDEAALLALNAKGGEVRVFPNGCISRSRGRGWRR